MRLVKTQITKYKCIEDSTPWRVDQVTCLVGKNEAGKSALLEALHRLNPVEEDDGDFDEEDYPRRFVVTDEGADDLQSAPVVTTKWKLDSKDDEILATTLPEIQLKEDGLITISRGYDNKTTWEVEANEAATVESLVTRQNFNAVEKTIVGDPQTIEELAGKLASMDGRTEKHDALMEYLEQRYPDQTLGGAVAAALEGVFPKFLYFTEYQKLPGMVSINDLVRREQHNDLTFGHRIFQALLSLVNSDAKTIADSGRSEQLITRLEGVSNRLSNEIFEYWSQNQHLRVDFRCDAGRSEDEPPFDDGWVFNTRIRNERHQASVNFDQRSTGFIWFFSFLVWFSQVKRNYGDRLIILLDEPGLSLHGNAQKDLLRYIKEKLQPHYQVVFSTHSPFMIDVENIFSLRTVEDIVKTETQNGEERTRIIGTKVGERIFSRDKDTILPLQGMVGFDLAQTMFVGPYVLVVEGPSEAAYIHWFSRQLIAKGREGLDIRWAPCPAESASKVSSFVTLFSGRGLKIAVLLDYHEGQKSMVGKLEESKLLDEGHILKTTDFTDTDEADIEDLLGWKLYAGLVNRAMRIPQESQLPADKPCDGEVRIIKEVKKRVGLLPPGVPEFDHYLPAQHLNLLTPDQIDKLPGLEDALDRFEAVFGQLNGLI